MNNIKYLLWDFDGTLAYRDGMWTDALLCVLRKNKIMNIEKEEIRPFLNIGFSWHSPDTPHSILFNGKKWWDFYEAYFQEIYEKLGVSINIARKLSKEVKKEYLSTEKWHVYDDSVNALTVLHEAGFTHVILSNHIPELVQIVTKLNLHQYFNRIYSSGFIGYEKPNIKIFDYVIKDLCTDRNNCIMIGDSYDADIGGAIRSNIKPILVRKENNKNYKWFCKDLVNIKECVESVCRDSRKIT
jgi:putative hydrolase of the HAD superfamily